MTTNENDINLEADYEVSLARSYPVGNLRLSPRNRVVVTGAVLVEMQAAGVVNDYALVQPKSFVEPIDG